MKRWKWFLMVGLMVAGLSGCAAMQDRTHNAAGGYIDACGNLPGLVGDDC